MSNPLKVCICGGGSSAQVMAVLAASKPDTEVNVLALYKDEAEEWSKVIENANMTLTFTAADGKTQEISGKPASVSKDAATAAAGSDLIILACPAFAHEGYLKAVSEHINKKTVIIGIPGQPGFEYQCKSLLGELTPQITLMSLELCPWMKQIVTFGLKLEVTRTTKNIRSSILRGKAIPRKPPLMSLQMLLGYDPAVQQVKHFVELIFISYSFVHPAIVYGKWKDWDGKGVDTEPLFYDVDEGTAKTIDGLGKEYQSVAHAITAQKPDVNLTEIPEFFVWLVEYYKDDIEDGSSLVNALKTNKAYNGITHSMTKVKNKYTPDLKCRYLAEDIPFGMIVVRGIAELLGVETPLCDTIIEWGQNKLGKIYLENGKLTGKDVSETRAPQKFGFTSLNEILTGIKDES